ncbi:DUF1294 domain-containing protein [Streptococcus caprae]|uniref:DUF1294 domain-containing protein n=1 Tax=Streptococcus caprae TaxID=1640501 RepID=A0ABV8CUW4_9STRE
MRDYVIYSLVWNAIVFVTYGVDKRRAIQDQWRISEKTLLLMALACGGFGALMGGYVFHHKTRKWYFVLSWYLGIGITLAFAYLIWKLSH